MTIIIIATSSLFHNSYSGAAATAGNNHNSDDETSSSNNNNTMKVAAPALSAQLLSSLRHNNHVGLNTATKVGNVGDKEKIKKINNDGKAVLIDIEQQQQQQKPNRPRSSSSSSITDLHDVEFPQYLPSQLQPGILHVGAGNFFRAHLATYMHDLLNDPTTFDDHRRWGIVACGVRSSCFDKRQQLSEQVRYR